ncbi:uncharacterized protein LOC104584080 [Brachypodium distachyon]|nr:uncharacterized protein LOC104584080 [Brachypodium distachyon]|eukprot:XP_010236500.2 uncharacterized protein LOC104584080 [Brachypodium distachyon]
MDRAPESESAVGDVTGCNGENATAVPQPRPAVPDLDEMQRQAAKEWIRKRILREEEEKWVALEVEVRRELVQEGFPLLSSGFVQSAAAAACAKGPVVARPAPLGTTTMAAQTAKEVEALSQANLSAALLLNHKNTNVAVTNVTSNKNLDKELSCTVCGITVTSETAMQEHRKGKSHRRKAAKLEQPITEAAQAEEDLPKNMGIFSKPNGSTALSVKQKNHDINTTSTVLAITGKEDLRCTLCGITTTDEKGMQDHLKGKIHRKKAAMLTQPMGEENAVRSKSNGSTAHLPAKRKREDSDVVAAASTQLPPAASNKKENLACTVCGITTSDERGMQDHLKGKIHRKKVAAAAPPQPLPEAAEQEQQHQRPEQEDDAYTPKKIKMGIKTGKVYEVVQMDGFVLCEVCNVRTADIVTMMCHLDGGKHASKVQQQQKQSKAEEKSLETATETAAPVVAGGDSETVVTMEANGMSHTVRRLVDGHLLCECCEVKLPREPESVMRAHLAGKKHAKKLKATGAAAAGEKAVTNDVEVANKTQIPGTHPGHEAKVAPCAGDSAVTPTEISDEKSPETAVSTMDTAAVAKKHEVEVAPMEIDGHAAQVGDLPALVVEEEKEEAKMNSSATQEQQAVETEEGEVAAIVGQEVKVQVEGQECTVLRQADGTLSCGLCGVHGRDKDGMLQHLYTRAHWHRVRSAQEIKEDVKSGDSDGIPVSESTTQVEN